MKVVLYRFENNSFIRLGTTEKAYDITFNVELSSVGEFSFKLPLGAKYAEHISNGVFVLLGSEFWGVIEDFKNDYANGICEASGKDLKGLLAQRVIIPTDFTSTDGTAGYMTVEGSTEHCIKFLWEKNAKSPPQQLRALPNMVIMQNKNLGKLDDKYMARFEALDLATQKLCDAVELGYKAWIETSTSTLCFDVYSGVDRTARQRDNSRAIFEIERNNIATLEYSEVRSGYKNAFYTTRSGSEFADEALTMLYYQADTPQSGYERRETHMTISASDTPAGGEYEDLKRLAQIEMKKQDIERGFSCELPPVNGYRQLWNVGDRVTIMNKPSGMTSDIQITGVTIVATDKEERHIVRFGSKESKYIAVNNKIFEV